ncbi:MAG TPA: preprotein translocase subunit SecG [Beijerinckiaceae bacterium]|nr:preprotein translocase subunit SecG [Beijerinckiaceae bacterium]
MQTVIIVIHLLIVLALIGVVLLQRSEGGLGLGGGGGVSGFMTGRGQANALTKATAILATLFFLTSLGLSILGSWTRAPRSIFDTTAPGAPAGQPAPSAGQGSDVLDQLQRMQGGGGAAQTPAPAPEAPAAPAVPQSR